MKKIILISALLLFSFNGWTDEIKVVCELKGWQGQAPSGQSPKKYEKPTEGFVYWTFDDESNELIGLSLDIAIDESFFHLIEVGERKVTEQSEKGFIIENIISNIIKHPVASNSEIHLYSTRLELNRFLGKSFFKGSNVQAITRIFSKSIEMYEWQWSVEGDCQLATKKF